MQSSLTLERMSLKQRPRLLGTNGWRILGRVVLAALIVLIGDARKSLAADEYDFNWLDPDKKISVLQNRKYLKALRPEISFLVGPSFNSPYRISLNLDPRASFYFTEWLGIEGFFHYTFSDESATFKALKGTGSDVMPVVRELRYEFGGMVKFLPWYAKINVFNLILYFDWYFGLGGGAVHNARDVRAKLTDAAVMVGEDRPAGVFSTGHQYHLGNHFLARLDFTWIFYPAPIYGASGDTTWNSNLGLALGLGFRL